MVDMELRSLSIARVACATDEHIEHESPRLREEGVDKTLVGAGAGAPSFPPEFSPQPHNDHAVHPHSVFAGNFRQNSSDYGAASFRVGLRQR